MAQFDVYKNTSTRTNKTYPYLVDIQNSLLDSISSRVVIPLGRLCAFKNESIEHLTPIVKYKDEKFLLLTLQLVSIPQTMLNKPIGNLQAMRNEIIGALDFMVTGI